jgi:hypothetical protein
LDNSSVRGWYDIHYDKHNKAKFISIKTVEEYRMLMKT